MLRLSVILSLGIVLVVFWAVPGWAQDSQVQKKDIQTLEQELDELKTTMQERKQKREEKQEKLTRVLGFMDRLSVFGLVEVEGFYQSDYEDNEKSDLELATVELGMEANLHDYVSTNVLLLYEEPTDEDIEVDEAFITLGNPSKFPVYIKAGRQYLPFGDYKTAMISDTLTLEIAETQETAFQVKFEEQGIYGGAYAFNGDVEESGDSDDQIENYGANLGYQMESGDLISDISVSYISNIGDSDTLGDTLDEEANKAVQDYVPGLAASYSMGFESIALIGEYICALEEFEQEEIEFEDDGARFSAWNAELNYSLDIQGRETVLAAAYQGTQEASDLELPENRYMTSVSVGLFKNTVSLSLEYAYDQDYDQDEGGTDEQAHKVTSQVALDF